MAGRLGAGRLGAGRLGAGRIAAWALVAVLSGVAGGPLAAPVRAEPVDPVVPPPSPYPPRPPDAPNYIERTEWVYHGDRATLRVYPTAWGWAASGIFTNGAQSYDAWAELLEHAPEANTLSMQNQFFCYWQLSTFTNPGKVGTWNLEPWRPVVSSIIMQNSGCNPGGPDDVLNW